MSNNNEDLSQEPRRKATRAEFLAAVNFRALPAYDDESFLIIRHDAPETAYKFIEVHVPLNAEGHGDTQDQADANVGLAVSILNADVSEPVWVIQGAQFSEPVSTQGAFTMRHVSSYRYLADPKKPSDAEITGKVCSILNVYHSVARIIKDQPQR